MKSNMKSNMNKVKYFSVLVSVLCLSSSYWVYAEDKVVKNPKKIIVGKPIVIIGDPKGDPCDNAPELEECGGDGGEPKPKNPVGSDNKTEAIL